MQFDEFERELRAGLERQPAPLRLKRNVMEQRRQRRSRQHGRMMWFERIAASLVLAGVAGSAVVGHYAVERRKGEEAKQQVLTALRITNRALDHMSEHLAEQDNQKQ